MQPPCNSRYAGLAASLFASPHPPKLVLFAAVRQGEGVTRTVCGLARELLREGKAVAALDHNLRCLPIPGAISPDLTVPGEPVILGAPLPAVTAAEPDTLASLVRRCDSVLVDAGSLHQSMDFLRLAPESAGIVLVVEAGATGAGQIASARRRIAEGGGVLLGLVLNKRRYPIPGWLYRILS